jgi:hypothetical protein
MNKKARPFFFILIMLLALFIIKPFSRKNDTKYPKLERNSSHLSYSKHAKCRMECRHISQEEVKQILETGTINYKKSNLQSDEGTEYALEGTTSDGQHVRIIFAPKATRTTVVTVIDLEKDWPCPYCN